MKTVLLLFSCVIGFASFAQYEDVMEAEVVVPEALIFTIVEVMPRFIPEDNSCEKLGTIKEKQLCAQDAFVEYSNKVPYPKKAKKQKQEGKVYVRYVVLEDGAVTDLTIAKSSGYPLLDEAALEHLKDVKYTIATQRGIPVKVQQVVRVQFKL